jgi:hypothetical protein
VTNIKDKCPYCRNTIKNVRSFMKWHVWPIGGKCLSCHKLLKSSTSFKVSIIMAYSMLISSLGV